MIDLADHRAHHAAAGQGGGDGLVANHHRHLFDQVGVHGHVAAPVGHLHSKGVALVGFDLEERPLQRVDYPLTRKLDPQQARDFAERKVDYDRTGPSRVGVFPEIHAARGTDFFRQADAAAQGVVGGLGREALLEAARGLTAQAHAARGVADTGLVEIRGFEQNIAGSFGDFTIKAAHDPRQGNRPATIEDDRVVRGKLAVLAIESAQGLAGLGRTHADDPAAQLLLVKSVQRLAGLQHDKIGDVDQVVDRALPGGLEPSLHPVGRVGHGEIVQVGGGIA